jgi:hypothetical protein
VNNSNAWLDYAQLVHGIALKDGAVCVAQQKTVQGGTVFLFQAGATIKRLFSF